MYLNNIEFTNDGKEVEKDFVDNWNIRDYCDVYNRKITISFVGLVIHKDRILFSFPKHYDFREINNEEKIDCMKEILSVISSNRLKVKGSFDNNTKDLKEEFPLRAYLNIANYYKKFGLYKSQERYSDVGYNGRINWNKTINKSNKIFREDSIMFYPFILNKVKDKDVFISECMDYVLNDAVKYIELIDKVISYRIRYNNKIFSNLNLVCNKLKQLRSKYFKDSEKKLIDSLIEYFVWKTNLKDNVRMLTLKFEDYWEDMMMKYLNGCFFDMKNDEIIWKEGQENSFEKPSKKSTESKSMEKNLKRLSFTVQYDHFMKVENKIYIFDSKYFNEVKELNYKQLFYHYQLKQEYQKDGDKIEVINGLLLPTEKKYHKNVHIDRTDLDDVKIIEHFINLKEVIAFYRKKIK